MTKANCNKVCGGFIVHSSGFTVHGSGCCRAFLLVSVCAFLCLVQASSHAQVGWFPDPELAKRQLTVYRIGSPPVIDGDLSDAAWQNLPRVTGTTDITFKHDYVPDQTLFTVAYDDENFYVAIDARDRFADTIVANETRRDEHLWSAGDDVLELFFDPDGTGERLIQIAFNPLGTQFDYRRDDSEGATLTGWNGSWSVGTKRGPNGWTAEVMFPFADLPLTTPQPGTGLKANIARTSRNKRVQVYSSWSIIRHSFHAAGDYGTWIFADPDLEVSWQDEFAINAEFVTSERERLESLSASSGYEIDLVKRLPADTRAGLAAETQEAKELSVQLLQELKSTTSLDALLAARTTGIRLSRTLEALANQLSLSGLAGPLDGLATGKNGITDTDQYWLLRGVRGVYALAKSSGAVAGIWDRKIDKRVVAASYDIYELETLEKKEYANERFDTVENVEQNGNVLTFDCRNPILSGLKIVKRYELLNDGRILAKQVGVSQPGTDKRLLGMSSATIFDPEFRKTSRYNRVMSSGSAGGSDNRPTIDAAEVTRDMIQRGGSNKACGYAQFVLANKSTGTGLSQYLFKIDGQYVWIPYAMPSSYWNALGWEISFLGTFVKEKPFSSEMRYHLFDGDQVDFYHEYLNLPEVQAERAKLPVSPRMAGLAAAGYGQPVTGIRRDDFPGNMPNAVAAHKLLRSDEINLMWGIPRHNWSGELPTTPDEDILWINTRNSKLVERHRAGPVHEDAKVARKHFPKHLLGMYNVHTSLNKESATYRNHPEFALQNKDGSLTASTHFGSREVDADMSPGWTDAMVQQYAAFMDYFSMGFLYYDFFGGYSSPDWHDARVTQSTDFMYFDKSIRKVVMERDGILFFNGNPGQLYIDLTFIEAIARDKSMFEKEDDWWRWHHERMMYYKLFERENMACMPLVWVNYKAGERKTDDYGYDDNNQQFTNLILAFGFRPHVCYYEYDPELTREDGTVDMERIYNYEHPWHQIALEMHNTHMPEVGIEPRYWTDSKSLVEAYVLKKGPTYFFTSLNHHDQPIDLTSSADLSKLDLEPGKRLFRWNYTRRNDDEVPRLIGPETPGWDRLFTDIRCTSDILADDPRLSVTFPNATVDYTYISTLTQVPGVFISKEGQDLQLRIPQALRCKIDGETNEKARRVTLRANAVTPAVVGAWWPKAWGKPQVKVNGEVLAGPEFVTYGSEQFVMVPVAKGESSIHMSAR